MPTDTFLHLTDFHFWEVVLNPFRLLNKRLLGNVNVWLRRRHEYAVDRAEQFATDIAATGVRQAILSGDFASTSTHKEFEAAKVFVQRLADAGIELIAIPGNHDVYTFESARARRFEQYFDEWYPKEGPPARRTLAGGTPIVLVPTVCPNLISSKGRITPAQVDATARLLESCGSPVVVVGHYPVLHEVRGAYASKPGRRLRNAESLRRVLGECGRRVLYVSGHVHRFSYVRDAEYPELWHLTSGAFFRRDHALGIEGNYSKVSIGPDGFSVERYTWREKWEHAKLDATLP
ncbi:MAG: metallophosphoesterase [Candidatus Hydrogenedentota bacterium]